jgi:hypothetical protein
MAGERLTKITVQASLSPNDTERGNQTARVRFLLAGSWIDYYRGAYTQQRQFDVPDPDDVKRDYVKMAVDNLLALVKLDIQSRGLPYTVSASRDLGNDAATGWPKIAFDIEATQYQKVFDLDFFPYYTGANPGWAVLSKVSTLQPITLQAQVVPTGIYGSADGALYISAYQGNTAPFTYVWADDPTARTGIRQNLKAGKYPLTVSDQDGVSVTETFEVKSDPQLLVTVQQTETSITLVVSGGVAPYAVKWDDGPTDLERLNLTPSTYEATVSDSHGASQRVKVTLLAGKCYFSQNPVRLALDAGDAYRADPTTKPNLSFVAEVWVELDYLSGVYEQAGPQLEQPADLQGRTQFEVQAVLDAYMHEHVPPLGIGIVTRVDSVFKRFYLKSAERYGTPPITAALSTAQVHYVLCGGLDYAEAEAGRWSAYQAAVQPFLTWEPDYQKVLPGQPAYLYYQHVATGGDVQLWVTVRRTDGTSTSRLLTTLVDVRRWEVYCLAVGPAALSLTGDEVAGYDVWLATPAPASCAARCATSCWSAPTTRSSAFLSMPTRWAEPTCWQRWAPPSRRSR